jgi:hypothetical protein
VPRRAEYRISIYCSSSTEKEHFRKLLQGGDLVQIALSADGSAVPLQFFPEPLLRPDSISTAEWGNIVFGPNEAGQDLAGFAGVPSLAYRITYSVRRPVAELDRMQPTIRIRLDPQELEGDLLLVGLLAALSVGTAVIAIVAAIYYFIGRGTKT